MLKQIKKYYIYIVAIFVAFSLPVVSSANHQNMGQYGAKFFYGHFGQPHNYVLSGNFTFIVSTNAKVDRVTFMGFKANEPSLDISRAVFNNQSTSVTTASDGTKYFSFVWNSLGVEDGNYKLYANVHCDSCSPASQDYVVHYDGKGYLEFKVDNPAFTPPPNQGPAENTCKAKLSEATSSANKIYEKQKSNLLFVDNFLQQTTLFYENKNMEVDNPDLLSKMGQVRKDASDSVLLLEKSKDFNCEGNLKEQVDNYLENSAAARNKVEQYKDLVINLILEVLEKA